MKFNLFSFFAYENMVLFQVNRFFLFLPISLIRQNFHIFKQTSVSRALLIRIFFFQFPNIETIHFLAELKYFVTLPYASLRLSGMMLGKGFGSSPGFTIIRASKSKKMSF